MTAQGARTRARRVHQNVVELLRQRRCELVELAGVARDLLGAHDAGGLEALGGKLGLVGMRVERPDARGPLGPVGVPRHQDGLGAAARTHLKHAVARFGGSEERHRLRGKVGHNGLGLLDKAARGDLGGVEGAPGTRNALARLGQKAGGRKGVGGLAVGHPHGDVGHIHGRRLQAGLGKGERALLAQLVHKAVEEPCGDAAAVRHRLGHERLSILGHATKHRVGKAGGTLCAAAHKLDALAHHDMGGLVKEEQLIGRNAQRVAHAGSDLRGLGDIAVEGLVERAARGAHTQGELAREGAVLGLEMPEHLLGGTGVHKLADIGVSLAGDAQRAVGGHTGRGDSRHYSASQFPRLPRTEAANSLPSMARLPSGLTSTTSSTPCAQPKSRRLCHTTTSPAARGSSS